MLTNQDRRRILEEVKTSGSNDIIAALRGQISQTPVEMPTPEPVEIPEQPSRPIRISQPQQPKSNLVDSTKAMPTQLAQTGGEYIPKFPRPEGLPEAPPTGTISQAKEKNIADKILNVLANPLATFGRSVRGEDINPGNIRRGENPFDAFLLGMVNPASWAESAQYAVKEGKQGNYLAAGLNALGVLPLIPTSKIAAKSAPKLLKNWFAKQVGTRKPSTNTGMLKTGPEEVVKAPPLTEVDKLKIAKIKDKNIKRLQSDEYISKRSANTGESKESIMTQVNEYIDELNKAPIKFKAIGDPSMSNTLGYYRRPPSVTSRSGEIGIKRGLQKDLKFDTFETIDHEVKHLLSPTGKFDKGHPLYKEALEEVKQINKINDKLSRATTSKQADEAVGMYANIRSVTVPRMDKVYKNYPTLDIKREIPTKDFEYFIDPAEQQVRLLRGAEWFKRNYSWDGTKAGMTDDMLKEVFEQMSGRSPSKQMLPTDFKELLKNSQNTTYSTLRDVLSKAWALGPVGLTVGANKKQDGGLRDHMMSYMDFRGSDTTNVNLVMNAISQHESQNVADAEQEGGGPGRGAYQFEIGDKKGANTAMNRTANFLASPANRIFFGSNKTIKDFPNIYNKYISSPSQDFSKLSKEDQDALFLGDKIYGGKDRRDEFDKVLKSPTQENIFMYWLKNHKGKVNNKTVNKLTEEEIQQERLKWNERTKSIFRP
jgi:hypothetical protein